MFGVILLGIRHENFAVEIPDAERRVACRKIWIHEAIGRNLMKILIVGFYLAGMEIRCIQEIVTIGDAQRRAFVNGGVNPVVCAVIDSDNGVRSSSVGFQPEMEPSSLTKMKIADAEVPFFVT